ncbi:energy-coupling factor ABC transporter permease [Streptomonospora salina]|uniref:Cobalt/nickel transport system permease protein n=1 Tax=Streptomonospora salina TaxID=104205 RepID=A0A841E6S1_9ACTN|nr:energy-coupling factor ABC transporter permease [Streptomonospora salina]MBB5998144.1 cobalt/nickel transport system permease protein [Streptomonospora salina]
MHIPDGFINAPVSIGAGVAAVGAVAGCLRKARADTDERLVPMAGLAAAFIFAAQMINFPVAGGTSGHLLGGALAALLLGPYAGTLAVTVVLVVQAFLFADGGLTALGLNVLNMGVVTAFAAYGVFAVLIRLLPKTRSAAVAAGGLAAGLSVPVSAMAFVAEYALGGTTDVAIGTVAAAMGGVHLLIGIGEGLITGATLAAVLRVRPDLVFAARHLASPVPHASPVRPAAGG